MKSIEKTLYNMSKAHQRESAKSQGFYDGRFRTRKIELKKHKNPRHKKSIFNNE